MAPKAKQKEPKKTAKSMTAAHKAALAEGREQGRAVRDYLEALEAHKPKRGRKRTPDSIQKQLGKVEAELESASPFEKLHLLQSRADLVAELESSSVKVDLAELEAAFIESAASYSERKGITYETWRQMGIKPAVLRDAGISR